MDLHRAKMLVMLLAAAGLTLFALCGCFHQTWMFMTGDACFLAMAAIWWLFNRCPHCGKHLGRDTGLYCPHCGKKL